MPWLCHPSADADNTHPHINPTCGRLNERCQTCAHRMCTICASRSLGLAKKLEAQTLSTRHGLNLEALDERLRRLERLECVEESEQATGLETKRDVGEKKGEKEQTAQTASTEDCKLGGRRRICEEKN